MSGTFRCGFESLRSEHSDVPATVQGQLPPWLRGRLLRIGPGVFDIGGRSVNHWFDGLSMMFRFAFTDDGVRYSNRFLRSKCYDAVQRRHEQSYDQFASLPPRSLLQKLAATLDYPLTYGDNNLVAFGQYGDSFLALGETPVDVRIDPDTLETLGPLDLGSNVLQMTTSAHPHYDRERREVVSMGTFIFPHLSRYKIWTLPFGSTRRTVLAEIRTDRPAWLHAFGMTRDYVVLIEHPFVASPLDLLGMQLSEKPFYQNFGWQPDRLTRIHVIDRRTGEQTGSFTAPPGFFLHVVNSWQDDARGVICCDVPLYSDASLLSAFFLDTIRAPTGGVVPRSRLVRYEIPMRGKGAVGAPRTVCSVHLEMPWIDSRRSGQPYRVVWGVSQDRPGDLQDRLVKIDTTGSDPDANWTWWHEPDCYPSEPVFVPRPGGTEEDDGVLLSVVVDGARHESFVVCLDACTMQEQARVLAPDLIPFGLHGAWNDLFSPME